MQTKSPSSVLVILGLIAFIGIVALRIAFPIAVLVQKPLVWAYSSLLIIAVVGVISRCVGYRRERRAEKMKLIRQYQHGGFSNEMVPLWSCLWQLVRLLRWGWNGGQGRQTGETFSLQATSPIKRSIIRAVKKYPCPCPGPHSA